MRVRYAGFAAGLMFLVGLGAVRSLAAQPVPAEALEAMQSRLVGPLCVTAVADGASGSGINASDSRRPK